MENNKELGTKENTIYVDVTHFKDMCNLLRYIEKYNYCKMPDGFYYDMDIEFNTNNGPLTIEELVIKFIKENGGTDRW